MLTMRDEHGIGSRVDESRRLVVRLDAPPTITVRGQSELNDANPEDTLTTAFAAADDVAVASVELHYAIRRGGSIANEPESGHRDVNATGLGTPTARGVAALPLAPLALKPGDVISNRLRRGRQPAGAQRPERHLVARKGADDRGGRRADRDAAGTAAARRRSGRRSTRSGRTSLRAVRRRSGCVRPPTRPGAATPAGMPAAAARSTSASIPCAT